MDPWTLNPITGVLVDQGPSIGTFGSMTMMTRVGRVTLTVQSVIYGLVYVQAKEEHGFPIGTVHVARQMPDFIIGEPTVMSFDGGVYEALRGMDYARVAAQAKIEHVRVQLGTLGWALGVAWEMFDAEEAEALGWDQIMTAVGEDLSLFRHGLLQDAGARAMAASTVIDKLGRFNPMSRAAIICSSERRLEQWVELGQGILTHLDRRRIGLVMLLEKAWDVRNQALRELIEMSRWWQPGRVIDLQQARCLADRIRECMNIIGSVVIGPYTKHAFAHCQRDLEDAADLLERFDDNGQKLAMQAGRIIDRVIRSLRLLEYHRTLEEILCAVSVAEKIGRPISREDARNFLQALRDVRTEFSRPELEDGFETPILFDAGRHVTTAITVLEHGRDAEKALTCSRGALKSAVACFGDALNN